MSKSGKILLISAAVLVFGAGCEKNTPILIKTNMQETVTFQTQDNVTIVGDFYMAQQPNGKAVLLLHMMPALKYSWKEFAQKLQTDGYSVLAIDLRGHGESVKQNGNTLNYKNFSDSEHQASALDVAASLEFLHKKGFKDENIIVCGASIGANLALEALVNYKNITKAIAFSPGLDFRGVTTKDKIEQLNANQKIFIAASEEDKYSADSSKILKEAARAQTQLKIFTDNAGHGTAMFQKHPDLMDEIINWLK